MWIITKLGEAINATIEAGRDGTAADVAAEAVNVFL